MAKIFQCSISHVYTTFETEIKLFQPLKLFQNYFSDIEHVGKIFIWAATSFWNNFSRISTRWNKILFQSDVDEGWNNAEKFHFTCNHGINIDKNELYACFCWFRWQPLGLVVIGVSLYLLLGKGDLLSAVFEMPYIQYFIIILIFCGCAILVLAIFGLVANRVANFHFLVAVCRLSFAWVLEGIGWHGGAIGRATDLRFTGRGFESWLGAIA